MSFEPHDYLRHILIEAAQPRPSGWRTRGIYSTRVRHLSGARQRSTRATAVISSADVRHLLLAREGFGQATRGIYPARVTDLVARVKATIRHG
jgi:hypothetical protein